MARFNDDEDSVLSKMTQNKGLFKKIGLGVASVLLAWNSFTMLDETERGLQYRFGKLVTNNTEDLVKPGFKFRGCTR